jgi:hypothetical protein
MPRDTITRRQRCLRYRHAAIARHAISLPAYCHCHSHFTLIAPLMPFRSLLMLMISPFRIFSRHAMLIRPFFIAAAIAMPPLAAATPRRSCADYAIIFIFDAIIAAIIFFFEIISFRRHFIFTLRRCCCFSSRFRFAEPPPPLLPLYCHSHEFIDIAASADF